MKDRKTKRLTSEITNQLFELGTWDWDMETDELVYNALFFEMLGYEKPEQSFNMTKWRDMIHPTDLPRVEKTLEGFYLGETEFYSLDMRFRHKDGHYIWIREIGKAIIWDEKGKPVKSKGGLQNIDKMAVAQQNIQAMFDANPHASVIFDDTFTIVGGNPAVMRLFHAESREVFLEQATDMIRNAFPRSADRTRPYYGIEHRLKKAVDEGYNQFETIMIIDGEEIPVNIIMVKIKYNNSFAIAAYEFDLRAQKSIQRELEHQDKLLRASNEVASILLSSRLDDYSSKMRECLSILGRAAEVDRVCIWKNIMRDKMYATQILEWSEGVKPVPRAGLTIDMPYDQVAPDWENTINRGECISAIASQMSEAMQALLAPQGAKSLLLVPIHMQGAFWGLIGFDDCVRERTFTELEANVLRTTGLMLASALLRYNVSQANQELVTQLKENIEKEQSAKQNLMIYNEMLSTFHSEHISQQTIGTVTRLIGEELEFDRVTIFEWIGGKAVIVSTWEQEYCDHYKITAEDADLFYDYLKDDALLFIRENGDREWRERLQLHDDVVSACILRSKQGSQDVILFFEHHRLKELSGIDAGFFLNVSHIVSSLINKVHLNEQKEQFSRELETKVEERTQELRAMTLKAENAAIAKTEFLANMSHEIRTPMNAIIGMAELLTLEKLPEEQKKYVADIKDSATSLLAVINDILDLSKIEVGKLKISPAHYNFRTFLDNIISMTRFIIAEKSIRFLVEIPETLPTFLYGDNIRLRQVLLNLLSNAVKYTDRGHVCLLVSVEAGNVVFAVEDTGMGINEEDLARLFAPYEQLDERKNRMRTGTGLGLSIAKSLVYMMDGDIWVESKYGVGSIFYVKIPLTPGDEQFVRTDAGEISFVQAPDAKILLVEDNPANTKVALGHLRHSGITADVAEDGKIAVEKVQQKNYDLVLMDHMMPVMDGIEATEQIRRLGGKYEKLPIIALSANALSSSVELFKNAGMNDFLAKPINVKEINWILKKWLPPQRILGEEDYAKLVGGEPLGPRLLQASTLPEVNVKVGLLKCGGDQEVYEGALVLQMKLLGAACRSLANYLEAGEIERFVIEVHGLKGALLSLGIERLGEAAGNLETAAKEGHLAYCGQALPDMISCLLSLEKELMEIYAEEAAPGKGKSLAPEEILGWLRRIDLEIPQALSDLNFTRAESILEEARRHSFGQEIDSILKEMKDAIVFFDSEKAVELAAGLRELEGDLKK